VKDVKGQYVTLEPMLRQVPAPSGSPLKRPGDPEEEANWVEEDIGLYSEAEVTAWRLSLMETSYQKEVLQSISTSLCEEDMSCRTPSKGYSMSLKFKNFLDTSEDLQQGLTGGFMEEIKNKLSLYAAEICLTGVAITCIQWVVLLVMTIANMWRRGCKTGLGSAGCCSRQQPTHEQVDPLADNASMQLKQLSDALEDQSRSFRLVNPVYQHRKQVINTLRSLNDSYGVGSNTMSEQLSASFNEAKEGQ
jgi:hypothetical protein